MSARDRRSVVVIGGGWAGCAAAVELARCGHSVELHEAAIALGGRARAVVRDGLPLDNGQHLLLGAYTDTLAFAAAIRDRTSSAWTIEPLALRPFARAQRNTLSLSTRHAPAPLALLAGLVRARGLPIGARIATIRWFVRQRRNGWQCAPDLTVAGLLADAPAVVRDDLWHPLCLAALNTPPARASAQVFLNILRETFGAGAHATSLVLPREGLAEAVPEAAARWLAANGHPVRRSTRTRIRRIDADGVLLEASGEHARADAVIVAVGPHQLASAFAPGIERDHPSIVQALASVARFDYEPITTVYLGYAAARALPRGLLRLDDAPGQWIFDRSDILERAAASATRAPMRSLVSVVISARGPHSALDHAALVGATDGQLRRLAPDLAPLVWSRVIEEKRATYACVPGLARPACGRLVERVGLAGDYAYAAFPATLEAAVRSGRIAAHAIIGAPSARSLDPHACG
ncbi:MAG TPA: hydroxysqualene dehydroxylase HpnE [Casimicrobiaceae bacterium]|nr:hydroxysqualene dehydroxylase HpnE [Casimicrobiaceae bacterium]